MRGGVSPKTCEKAHGWDENFHEEEEEEDEDDAIVRALRQRMQQVFVCVHTCRLCWMS